MAKQEPKGQPPARQNAGQALVKQESDFVDRVSEHIQQLTEGGELELPENYSLSNALKAAWLTLQEVEDKDHRPALQVCTKPSIANALLDMAVQGLSPQKEQCYFIVYGKTLVCMRSTFGHQAVFRRAYGVASEVWAEVIYEGDEVSYEIERGQKMVTGHKQRFGNIRGDKIVGAYAIAEPAGRPRRCVIMTMDQIRRAWEQGQTKGASPAHKGFPDEMAKKTVIHRVLKPLINAADDSILVRAARRQDALIAEAEMDEEVGELANAEVLEIEGGGGGEESAEGNEVKARTDPAPVEERQAPPATAKAVGKGDPEPAQPRLDGPGW